MKNSNKLKLDPSYSMNTPLRQLKIITPPMVTVNLLLSWVAISLWLSALRGDLREFLWMLVATTAGAFAEAIAIVFGAAISFDEPNDRDERQVRKP